MDLLIIMPRTHERGERMSVRIRHLIPRDFLQLLNACVAVEPLWSAYSKYVDDLTDYAVDFRYPGDSPALLEVKAALRHCRTLRAEAPLRIGAQNLVMVCRREGFSAGSEKRRHLKSFGCSALT